MIQRILRHLAGHGIIVLMVAVAFLVLLRGLNVGIILLFVLPPLFAMLHTRPTFSAATRWVAWAFLGAVGLGSLIAPFPQLFPKLGGVAQQLAPWQDRMLAWYTAVYLLWF